MWAEVLGSASLALLALGLFLRWVRMPRSGPDGEREGVPPSPLPQQVPLDPRIAQAVADAGHDLYARADGVDLPDGAKR